MKNLQDKNEQNTEVKQEAPMELLTGILSDYRTLNVFKMIVQRRHILFREFLEDDKPENIKDDISILKKTLNQLKDVNLIKEQAAPIDLFNTYYITAYGLSVDRFLRRNT